MGVFFCGGVAGARVFACVEPRRAGCKKGTSKRVSFLCSEHEWWRRFLDVQSLCMRQSSLESGRSLLKSAPVPATSNPTPQIKPLFTRPLRQQRSLQPSKHCCTLSHTHRDIARKTSCLPASHAPLPAPTGPDCGRTCSPLAPDARALASGGPPSFAARKKGWGVAR